MASRSWGAKAVEAAAGALSALGRIALEVLPLLCILGGAAFGIRALWAAALEDPRYRLGGETLSVAEAERFRPEALAEVERFGSLSRGRCILAPFLLADLRAEAAESRWVRRVARMRRIFPDRLEVELVLRTPVAQVKRNYFWLVDDEAVLLPVAGAAAAHPGLPEIVGAPPETLARQPAAGRAWSDTAVPDALALLARFAASPAGEDLHVKRVVVRRGEFLDALRRRRADRARFELETREGITVRWGTWNRGDLPDEMTCAEKIDLLRRLLARDLSTASGLCLDVRTRVPGFSFTPTP